MNKCDDDGLWSVIQHKITEIAPSLPEGVLTQELLDQFLDLETLLAEAFEP